MISDTKTFNQVVAMVQDLSPSNQYQLIEIIKRNMLTLSNPIQKIEPEQSIWIPDFFENTAGAWQGKKLVRPKQGGFETRLEDWVEQT